MMRMKVANPTVVKKKMTIEVKVNGLLPYVD